MLPLFSNVLPNGFVGLTHTGNKHPIHSLTGKCKHVSSTHVFIYTFVYSLSMLIYSHVCCVLVAQLYLTLCDPMDCSLPGSFVHGILQARILEWVVISFSNILS